MNRSFQTKIIKTEVPAGHQVARVENDRRGSEAQEMQDSKWRSLLFVNCLSD